MRQMRTRQAGRPDKARSITRFSLVWLGAGALILLLTASTFTYSIYLENNDRFCASCHTNPESTYVNREHQSPVDLASAHAAKQVTCIECHSGAGPVGRLDAVMLGARDLRAYVSGHFPQPVPLTHPISDANCLKCHQDVLQNRTFDNHFHVFLSRWQKAAPQTAATCVTCHASHATDGDSQIAWLNKSQTVAQCNACHRTAGVEGEG